MKIMPYMSKGIVFLHTDGKMELLPMQVIPATDGGTILRLGRTTLWFTKEGGFDGTEHKMGNDVPQDVLDQMEKLLKQEVENDGLAPAESYFQPGARGYVQEMAARPKPSGGN